MLSGFGGVPGTKMKIMKFRRIENILERRGFTVVPRQNARPVPDIDNSGVRFAGLQHTLPVIDDFAQRDRDIILITIPLNNKRPVASTCKSRAENWVETGNILTEVLFHRDLFKARMVCGVEEDFTTKLSGLHEEVCPERRVQCRCCCTNSCSFRMPTTTRSQFRLLLKPASAPTWNPSRRMMVNLPLGNGKRRN
jgi:hypothetical protein